MNGNGHASLSSADGRLTYDLQVGSNRVGRAKAACEIVLRSSRSISSKHADLQVSLDETGNLVVSLADLESTNGTFVNGTHLTGRRQRPVRLQDGDVLRFGYDERSFVVHIRPPYALEDNDDDQDADQDANNEIGNGNDYETSQDLGASSLKEDEEPPRLLSPIAHLGQSGSNATENNEDPLGATTVGPPSRHSAATDVGPPLSPQRRNWQRKLDSLQRRIDRIEAAATTPRLASAARTLASGTRDLRMHDELAIRRLDMRVQELERSAARREQERPVSSESRHQSPHARSSSPRARPRSAQRLSPVQDGPMHINELDYNTVDDDDRMPTRSPVLFTSRPRSRRQRSPVRQPSAGPSSAASDSRVSPSSWSRDFGSFDRRKDTSFFSASFDADEDSPRAKKRGSLHTPRNGTSPVGAESSARMQEGVAQAWAAKPLDPDDIVLSDDEQEDPHSLSENRAAASRHSSRTCIKAGLGMLDRFDRRRMQTTSRRILFRWKQVALHLGAVHKQIDQNHLLRLQRTVFRHWKSSCARDANSKKAPKEMAPHHADAQRRGGALWMARIFFRVQESRRRQLVRAHIARWRRYIALCNLTDRVSARKMTNHFSAWRQLMRKERNAEKPSQSTSSRDAGIQKELKPSAMQLDELQDLTEELRISEQTSALKDINLMFVKRANVQMARSWASWRVSVHKQRRAEQLERVDCILRRMNRQAQLARALSRWRIEARANEYERAIEAQGQLWTSFRRWKDTRIETRTAKKAATTCWRALHRTLRIAVARALSHWRLVTGAAKFRAAKRAGFVMWAANFVQRPCLRAKVLRQVFRGWQSVARERKSAARFLCHAFVRHRTRPLCHSALQRWRWQASPPGAQESTSGQLEELQEESRRLQEQLRQSKEDQAKALLSSEEHDRECRELEAQVGTLREQLIEEQRSLTAAKESITKLESALQDSRRSKRTSVSSKRAAVEDALEKAQRAAESAREAAQRAETSAATAVSRAESNARAESARFRPREVHENDPSTGKQFESIVKKILEEFRRDKDATGAEVLETLRACLHAAEDRATHAEERAQAQLRAFEQAAQEQAQAQEARQAAFTAALEATEARAKTAEELLLASSSASLSRESSLSTSSREDVEKLRSDLDLANKRIAAYEGQVARLLTQHTTDQRVANESLQTALDAALARADAAERRLSRHLDEDLSASLKGELHRLRTQLEEAKCRAVVAEEEAARAKTSTEALQKETKLKDPVTSAEDAPFRARGSSDASKAQTVGVTASLSQDEVTQDVSLRSYDTAPNVCHEASHVDLTGNESHAHHLVLVAAWFGGVRSVLVQRPGKVVLANAFAKWQHSTRLASFRKKRATRSLRHLQHEHLRLIFTVWRQSLNEGRRTRRVLHFTSARYADSTLQQRAFYRLKHALHQRRQLRVTLRAWSSQASRERAKRREHLRAVVARRSHTVKIKVWLAWRAHVSAQHTHDRVLKIFEAYGTIVAEKNQRTRRQLAWASFRAWKHRVIHAKRIRQKALMHMCRTRRIMQLWWAFVRWRKHEGLDDGEHAHLEARLELSRRRCGALVRCIKQHFRHSTRRAFGHWRVWARIQGVLVRQRGKLLRFEAKLRIRMRVGQILRQWRRVAREAGARRRQHLEILRARAEIRLLRETFTLWAAEGQQTKRVSELSSRCASRVLKAAFFGWRELVILRRAGELGLSQRLTSRTLRAVFAAWADGTRLNEAQRSSMRRILRRMKVFVLKMGWRALYEHYIGDRELAQARLRVSGKVRELAERSNRLLADQGELTLDFDAEGEHGGGGGDKAFAFSKDDGFDVPVGDESLPMDEVSPASPSANRSPLRAAVTSPLSSGATRMSRKGRKSKRRKSRRASASVANGDENQENTSMNQARSGTNALEQQQDNRKEVLRFGDPRAALRETSVAEGPEMTLEEQQQMLIEALLGQVQTLAKREEHKRKLLAKIVVPASEGEAKSAKQSRGLVIKHLQEIDALRGELDAVRRVSTEQERAAAKNLRAVCRERDDLEHELKQVQRAAARERQRLESYSRDAERRLDKLNELLSVQAGRVDSYQNSVAGTEALALLRAQVGASRKSESKARARLRDLGEAHMRLRQEHELLVQKFEEVSQQTKLREAVRTLRAQLEDLRARNGLSEHVRRATALFPLSHRARSLTIEEALGHLLATSEPSA